MGEEIHEELLFAKTLKTDTKGESIFNVLSDFFKEKFIPYTNVISVATDGVPAVVGRYRGFISRLKRIIPEVECLDEDIQTYVQHLIALHDDFKFRFKDILSIEIPPWIINPLDETEVELTETEVLQEELLELSINEELKVTFKRGYQKFWLQAEIPEKYPGLCAVESGFEFSEKGAISDEQLLAMRQLSPVSHVHKVKAATALMLGSKDKRVPVSQGLDFYHRLKANGCPARVYMYDDCHSLTMLPNEVDNLINGVLWMLKYVNKDD
ncbi:Acylamino-acid-releasing enzyme [Eumeta japonica]|uniref:Acylamino-acid-releasing enzyme n=1 Tax=Eumeta variegata TaxID=151549 RepID=A0A4C1VLF4_EUMVA|nr:Acylamino-acid-releasing enzyme [Eumeta japonica]